MSRNKLRLKAELLRVDEGDTTQLLFAKQKPSNPNPGYSFILLYFDT